MRHFNTMGLLVAASMCGISSGLDAGGDTMVRGVDETGDTAASFTDLDQADVVENDAPVMGGDDGSTDDSDGSTTITTDEPVTIGGADDDDDADADEDESEDSEDADEDGDDD